MSKVIWGLQHWQNAQKNGLIHADFAFGFVHFGYTTLAAIAFDTRNNNDAVNRFYESNCFKLVREYETPEGRKMNEYRWQ